MTRAQAIGSAEACLVNRNDPMHDSVPYLRNALPDDTDILHEYFIPRSQFVSFVDGMRKVLTDNKTNLLNASVRVVHQEDNFLTYAPEPAFSLVLYINQTTDEDGNRRMKKATEDLIDLTIAHKGRFFLPYQLYYSRDQLQRSYPQINDFFAAKKKYDPGEVLPTRFIRSTGRDFTSSLRRELVGLCAGQGSSVTPLCRAEREQHGRARHGSGHDQLRVRVETGQLFALLLVHRFPHRARVLRSAQGYGQRLRIRGRLNFQNRQSRR